MSFGTTIPVTGLNLGFAGQITRLDDFVIASRPVLQYSTGTTPALNINFGDPVVIVPTTGGGDSYQSVLDFISNSSGTFTAAKFAGVCNREVKTNLAYTSLGNNGTPQLGNYAPLEMCEALERSSILVHLNVAGTPVSQGPVFIRTVLNGGISAGLVGGFEGAADGSNTISLAGIAVFRTGFVDANGMAEITLLNRVAA